MNEKPCIWTGSETPRAVRGRHDEDCDGDGCRGCEPCTEPHCIVCGIEHVLGATNTRPVGLSSTDVILSAQAGVQTCPRCVGAARTNLHEIVELDRALPDQAANHSRDSDPHRDHVLGGDAMAAMASATTIGAYLPGDPFGALASLASWEDDWRHLFEHGPAGKASVKAAAWYLDRHLSLAAQRHPAFDEFAAELPRIVAGLERILDAGERDDTTAAACFRDGCGGQLVRKVNPLLAPAEGRRGFDSEGRTDDYGCRRCGRTYDEAAYWLAVKEAYEASA